MNRREPEQISGLHVIVSHDRKVSWHPDSQGLLQIQNTEGKPIVHAENRGQTPKRLGQAG